MLSLLVVVSVSSVGLFSAISDMFSSPSIWLLAFEIAEVDGSSFPIVIGLLLSKTSIF